MVFVVCLFVLGMYRVLVSVWCLHRGVVRCLLFVVCSSLCVVGVCCRVLFVLLYVCHVLRVGSRVAVV